MIDEQTLYAQELVAPGATPSAPAMMSATCVPWPPPQPMADGLQSIGSGSGVERRAAGAAGPGLADEVQPADDLRGREQLHALVGVIGLAVLLSFVLTPYACL